MCGRFVEFSDVEKLKQYFPIDEVKCEMVPNYNIAPSQEIAAIVRQKNLNVLGKLHWGLVPHWAKDISTGYKMINARIESVATKPSFRHAFKSHRCLIPADGFYEWKGPAGNKQPYYITLPNEKPFAFAGLWEIWHDKNDSSNTYKSCTIITRDACESVKDIHNRMPAVLHPNVYKTWLDPDNQDNAGLQKLLAKKTVTKFKAKPVSRQVNRADVNDPFNIA